MKMPEEVNRIMTDRLSSILFCPSTLSMRMLENEGITTGVHIVGDVMYDAIKHFGPMADKSRILSKYNLHGKYCLATIHRAENTDNSQRLQNIFDSLGRYPSTVIIPMHPRTKGKLEKFGIKPKSYGNNKMLIIQPVSYIDSICLLKNADTLYTDSGGMQKEAYYLKTPCVTLRDETEWIETVESGWNTLVGADCNKILNTFRSRTKTLPYMELYGSIGASDRIVKILEKAIKK